MFKRFFLGAAASLAIALTAIVATGSAASAATIPAAGIVTVSYSFVQEGSLQTGVAKLHYGDGTVDQSGFDFVGKDYTGEDGGAVYLLNTNGRLQFWANNEGQGGVVRLPSRWAAFPKFESRVYNRQGVDLLKGATYAIYDEGNEVYIRARITNILAVRAQPRLPVVEPLPPVVVSPPKQVPAPDPVQSAGLLITYPAQNQRFTNFPRSLKVAWTGDSARRHRLEIACIGAVNACYPVVGINENTAYLYSENFATSQQIDFTGDGWFRVRVQAIKDDGSYGPFSDYVSLNFDTSQYAVVPSPVVSNGPSITYPVNEQLFTNFPRTLSVNWKSNGSANYLVDVQCDTCGQSAWESLRTYTVGNSMTQLRDLMLPGDNQYRVRVKSVDVNNRDTSGWSDFVYFRFRTPSQQVLPYFAPTILNPMNQAVLGNFPRKAFINWKTNGGKYFVLDIQCDTCGTTPWTSIGMYTLGSLSKEDIIFPGMNQYRIRVKSVDEQGNDTSAWSDYTYFSFNI
jgi:hypothetical protein